MCETKIFKKNGIITVVLNNAKKQQYCVLYLIKVMLNYTIY